MPTVHQPTDTDPLPPPGTSPYFRRCAVLAEAVRLELARRAAAPAA
jgi:hypothetical protein